MLPILQLNCYLNVNENCKICWNWYIWYIDVICFKYHINFVVLPFNSKVINSYQISWKILVKYKVVRMKEGLSVNYDFLKLKSMIKNIFNVKLTTFTLNVNFWNIFAFTNDTKFKNCRCVAEKLPITIKSMLVDILKAKKCNMVFKAVWAFSLTTFWVTASNFLRVL